MNAWNGRRLACIIGGAVLIAVGHVIPGFGWLTEAGFGLIGVAVRTPGHVPKPKDLDFPPSPPGETPTAVLPKP